MMIMPSNNASGLVHFLAGKYPGKIGWLISPNSWKNPPYYMPFALDNGCFKRWDENKFIWMIGKIMLLRRKPLWVVVPDVVGDAKGTLELWREWAPWLEKQGFKQLAFACQDGMTSQNVPKEAFCCFIGGTTQWKIKNAHKFKGVAEWLHIGRISTPNRIDWALRIGADSIDGTGFFKARGVQYQSLINYFLGNPQCKLIK